MVTSMQNIMIKWEQRKCLKELEYILKAVNSAHLDIKCKIELDTWISELNTYTKDAYNTK